MLRSSLRALVALALLLVAGCQRAPGGTVPPPPPLPADLGHRVYLASEQSLQLLRPGLAGLEIEKSVPLHTEAPVDMAVSRHGLVLWRDWEMLAYELDLKFRGRRFVDLKRPYLQGCLRTFSHGFVADYGTTLQLLDERLRPLGSYPLPGFVEEMEVVDDRAYIFDPAATGQFLLQLELSRPASPRLIQQARIGEGARKGYHWLDLGARQWFVHTPSEVLLFDTQNLAVAPRRLPALPPFRLWRTTADPPLWVLADDPELTLLSLHLTPSGWSVGHRLALQGSRHPLGAAPFLKRAGSRLYASDGGALWVVDLAAPRPLILQTLEYRHGLTLAILPTGPKAGQPPHR